jgi:hypothetical protein
MKRQTRTIRDYLEDILRYAEKVQNFVADVPSLEAFAEDEMRVMATIRALEVIGEAVKHIPSSLIPIAQPKFTKTSMPNNPLLKVPPASRGNRTHAPHAVPLAKRGEP